MYKNTGFVSFLRCVMQPKKIDEAKRKRFVSVLTKQCSCDASVRFLVMGRTIFEVQCSTIQRPKKGCSSLIRYEHIQVRSRFKK